MKFNWKYQEIKVVLWGNWCLPICMWFFRSANNISTVWRKLHVCSEIAFQREDVITGRNEVAKVMFLHLSVILFTGGGGFCLNTCWDTTPLDQAPPGSRPPRSRPPPTRHPPRADTHPPADWNAFLFTFYNNKRNTFKIYTIQYKTN